MKGIIIIDKDDVTEGGTSREPKWISNVENEFLYTTFPTIQNGAGTITKEDTYRFAKRNAKGTMRRISYVGYILSISMKWALLTEAQYSELIDTITKTYFYIKFYWQGAWRVEPFYAGNPSGTPFKLKQTDGSPVYYRDVSFNAVSLYALDY